MEDIETHKSHCCVMHGCKYNENDCPVTLCTIKQTHPCPNCSDYDDNPIQVMTPISLGDILTDKPQVALRSLDWFENKENLKRPGIQREKELTFYAKYLENKILQLAQQRVIDNDKELVNSEDLKNYKMLLLTQLKLLKS